MKKKLFKITGILFLGAFGGFLFQLFVFPYLLNVSFFENFQFVKNFTERETIINPVEEIVITENTALKDSIEKIKKTIVAIRTETADGRILENSGIIITSDGLLVALAEKIPVNSNFDIFINGEKLKGEIVKRDVNKNLVLLKVDKTGLPTCGFADFDDLQLGERIFLIGFFFDEKGLPQKMVNEGVVRFFDKKKIETNIIEEEILKGSSLFNIEGRLLGLNFINEKGRVSAISIQEIKSFTGF